MTSSAYRLENCRIATMRPGTVPYGLISDAALVVRDGVIAWIGQSVDVPDQFASLPVTDLNGALVTPGLIDCHTHLVYGGDRASEFELRLNGASYEEVAKAGGGILSTVTATRASDEAALLEQSLPRLDALIADGCTSIEIKSGYGLTIEDEIRMLRVARELEKTRDVTIKTSWLAAHALPPEYKGRADDYIDEVCIPGLCRADEEGLVDAVDGFCEGIGFTKVQMERVFSTAQDLGLPVKLHAEQLSDLGGAAMAASYNALSADHLEYLGPDGVTAMASAGTVAVLLPGAFYTLRETKLPPMEALRDAGVDMAIASDCNPGSSPVTSVLLMLNMACTLFRMTPEEALAGLTRNAAKALGLNDRGMLDVGFRADLAVWSVDLPAALSYRIGFNPLIARYVEGRPC